MEEESQMSKDSLHPDWNATARDPKEAQLRIYPAIYLGEKEIENANLAD